MLTVQDLHCDSNPTHFLINHHQYYEGLITVYAGFPPKKAGLKFCRQKEVTCMIDWRFHQGISNTLHHIITILIATFYPDVFHNAHDNWLSTMKKG